MIGKNSPLTNRTAFSPFHRIKALAAIMSTALALNAAVPARADQVVMRNGDCYHGRILSVTTNLLVLQSEVLGTIKLPRDKVTTITFGTSAATNVPVSASPATGLAGLLSVAETNVSFDLSAMLRELKNQTNLIQQVQAEFLDAAGPEAKENFNQLLVGLGSGRITLNDLRAKAKTAADQIRSYKRELGDDIGDALDGYLVILDTFLKEATPAAGTNTNPPVAGAKTNSAPAVKEK